MSDSQGVFEWTASPAAVMRHTILVPDEIVRESHGKQRPLRVLFDPPKRCRVSVLFNVGYSRVYRVPELKAMQFHFSSADVHEVGGSHNRALPPWPVLNAFQEEADVDTIVRACWISVMVTAEALALESRSPLAHTSYAFLGHYFGTAKRRANAALVDALWIVVCALIESSAHDAQPAVSESLRKFATTAPTDNALVVDAQNAPFTCERWAAAGRWMARQCAPDTAIQLLDRDLPADWRSEPLALLEAGVFPNGGDCTEETAKAVVWPFHMYHARRRVFMQALQKCQQTPLSAWPPELLRLRRMAIHDLPPRLPHQGYECAQLALRCAEVAGAKLAFPEIMREMVAYRAQQRIWRMEVGWHAPDFEARTTRYAGISRRLAAPGTVSVLACLDGLPPCLTRCISRARATHRMPDQDRMRLSSMLVATEPLDARESDLESAENIARYLLDESHTTERTTQLAEIIKGARKARQEAIRGHSAGAPPSFVTGCKKIIGDTRTSTDHERTLRCHYAHAHPDSDVDCQRQCSQGKKGFCKTPLDHVLSILDW